MGAGPLQSFTFNGLGQFGLADMAEDNAMEGPFLQRARGVFLNEQGKLAAHPGFLVRNFANQISGQPVRSLHEYLQADGTSTLISAWDGGIGTGETNPAGNDISGSVTDSDGEWRFQNFNDKVLGFQAGQKLIVYNGSGNFATVSESSGTAPTGGIGTCAYGRVWQTDSTNTVLEYSGLLDETDWGGAGAGSIDFKNIWTVGTDAITAIAPFNGGLVVFGRRHIIFLSDGVGSEIGLNPTNVFVQDVVAGTGCVNQHTVQLIGEADILFMSSIGLQSLARIVQEKSNPLATVTPQVEESMRPTGQARQDKLRSAYWEERQVYILIDPDKGGLGDYWLVDVGRPFQNPYEAGRLCYPVFEGVDATYNPLCVAVLTAQNTVEDAPQFGGFESISNDGMIFDYDAVQHVADVRLAPSELGAPGRTKILKGIQLWMEQPIESSAEDLKFHYVPDFLDAPQFPSSQDAPVPDVAGTGTVVKVIAPAPRTEGEAITFGWDFTNDTLGRLGQVFHKFTVYYRVGGVAT